MLQQNSPPPPQLIVWNHLTVGPDIKQCVRLLSLGELESFRQNGQPFFIISFEKSFQIRHGLILRHRLDVQQEAHGQLVGHGEQGVPER